MAEVKKTRKSRAKKEPEEPKEPKEEKPIEHKKMVKVVDEEHKELEVEVVKPKKLKQSKIKGRPCRDNRGNVIYE